MLAQLGSVAFEVAPFNFHENSFDGSARFAEHPVVGRRPSLEFVGEGPETWAIQGRIFPEFTGGTDHLAALHDMRRSGRPQPWMRGDGVYMGWVVIDSVSERATHIGRQGVGRWIEFDVSLKRTDPPDAAGMFSLLVSLFG